MLYSALHAGRGPAAEDALRAALRGALAARVGLGVPRVRAAALDSALRNAGAAGAARRAGAGAAPAVPRLRLLPARLLPRAQVLGEGLQVLLIFA